MDFDPTTQEYGQWGFRMPDDYDGGQITAEFAVLGQTGSTGSVILGLQGIAYGDGDSIDVAWGTAKEVTDRISELNKMYLTPETAGITLAGTPTAEEVVQIRAYRKAGTDTFGGDARLHSVKLNFTRS